MSDKPAKAPKAQIHKPRIERTKLEKILVWGGLLVGLGAIATFRVGGASALGFLWTKFWSTTLDLFLAQFVAVAAFALAWVLRGATEIPKILVSIPGNRYAVKVRYKFGSIKRVGENVEWREGRRVASCNASLLQRTGWFGGYMMKSQVERRIIGGVIVYETAGLEATKSTNQQAIIELQAEEIAELRLQRARQVPEPSE